MSGGNNVAGFVVNKLKAELAGLKGAAVQNLDHLRVNVAKLVGLGRGRVGGTHGVTAQGEGFLLALTGVGDDPCGAVVVNRGVVVGVGGLGLVSLLHLVLVSSTVGILGHELLPCVRPGIVLGKRYGIALGDELAVTGLLVQLCLNSAVAGHHVVGLGGAVGGEPRLGHGDLGVLGRALTGVGDDPGGAVVVNRGVVVGVGGLGLVGLLDLVLVGGAVGILFWKLSPRLVPAVVLEKRHGFVLGPITPVTVLGLAALQDLNRDGVVINILFHIAGGILPNLLNGKIAIYGLQRAAERTGVGFGRDVHLATDVGTGSRAGKVDGGVRRQHACQHAVGKLDGHIARGVLDVEHHVAHGAVYLAGRHILPIGGKNVNLAQVELLHAGHIRVDDHGAFAVELHAANKQLVRLVELGGRQGNVGTAGGALVIDVDVAVLVGHACPHIGNLGKVVGNLCRIGFNLVKIDERGFRRIGVLHQLVGLA